MIIKTCELIGVKLDWVIARCLALKFDHVEHSKSGGIYLWLPKKFGEDKFELFRPSMDWAQGGPILEKIIGLHFKQWTDSPFESCCEAHINTQDGDWVAFGPTPLIAIMRCYVSSKLGDNIDVPEF